MKRQVVKVNGRITIEEAIKILHEKRIGSLVITDSRDRCRGIYTESDVIRNIAEKIPMDTPLEEVMTRDPITIREEASITEARMLMISHRIRHLPVVNRDGQLVGILTGRGLMDEIIGIPSMRE